MPTPEELYGSPAASAGPTATPATGGEQTYIPPEDVYGQPVATPDKLSKALSQVKEDLPAVGGAMAVAPVAGEVGTALGAPLGPPGMIIGGTIGSAIGAAIGGAGGKGYQVAYREITGDPKAPDNSYDAAVQIAKAGGEQAAWELGGQLAVRGIGKAAYYLRPKALENIEKMNVALQNVGGKFSAAQMSNSWLLHQLDSLTRGSLLGSGVMKAHDVLNDQAIKTIENGIRQDIAKGVTENLSGGELGQLFIDTVSNGKAGFKTAVGNMYEGLDTMVPHSLNVTPVVSQTPVGALVPQGPKAAPSIMSPSGVEYVAQKVEPVDISSMKAVAAKLQDDLNAIGFTGESGESRAQLNNILNADTRLSFSNAQSLRSNLLDAQRNLEGNIGKSKISGQINNFVDLITKSMDDAALQQGPEVFKRYQAIKDYANKGYNTFNNKFVADLLSASGDNPAEIGKRLGQAGNEQQIIDAKRAVRYSSVFNKDPSLSYGKVWPKMQAGYLDSILNRNSALKGVDIPPEATQESIQSLMQPQGASLLKEFTDPDKQRTLKQFFTKDQRDAIFEFAKTAERVQRKPTGGLGMIAKFGQGGMLLGAATGSVGLLPVAVATIPSYAMAHMMTFPPTAKIMAQALETSVKSPKALPLLTRLSAEAYKVNQAAEQ